MCGICFYLNRTASKPIIKNRCQGNISLRCTGFCFTKSDGISDEEVKSKSEAKKADNVSVLQPERFQLVN